MIVDAHLHAFSHTFFQALEEEAKKNNPSGPSLQEVAKKNHLELPSENPETHAKRWIQEMDHSHVTQTVCFASHPKEAESVHTMTLAFPDRFFPVCVVNPKMPEAESRIPYIIEKLEFRGLVLFPSLHHYFLKDQTWLLEYAQTHKLVLIVHCGILNIPLRHHLGIPKVYEIQYANPLDLISIANRYSQIAFQIPHFGAGFLRECMILGKSCANVYVDTSSSNSWIPTNGVTLEDTFLQALQCFGEQRILFGTDSSTFPRGWNFAIYETQLRILEKLCPKIQDREAILGKNTKHLYSSVRT
ncbi:MAG: amidohydrolase family protein [Planctomycetota bacterium]